MRNLFPADRGLLLLAWAALLAAVALWQVRSLVTHASAGIVDVARLARQHVVTRWGMLAIWTWLGWHLFVRTSF